MQDSLSQAVDTVLATLRLVQDKYGVIHNVKRFEVDGTPTNLLKFSLNGHDYDLFVTEKPTKHKHGFGGARRCIDINVSENGETLEHTLEASQDRHPSTQGKSTRPREIATT